MRTEDINIKITIPLPVDEPDKSGYIYTQDAIKKAVENFSPNVPLTTGDDLGTCIGSVNSIELSDDNKVMLVDATVFAAGTCEIIGEQENGIIKDYRITSFGICR